VRKRYIDAEQTQRWCLYNIENIRKTMTPPLETVTAIFDMSKFSTANMVLWPTTTTTTTTTVTSVLALSLNRFF
jgi:hypothetical protein